MASTDSSSSEASKEKNEERLKSKKSKKIEKVPKELQQFLMERAEKSRDLKLKMGGSQSQTSSPPPKHATQKEEYVKPSGTGHEATGAGDGGGGKRDGKKNDHDGAGSAGGGDDERKDGESGDGRDKKDDKGYIYCVKCRFFFEPKHFENHYCKKASTIDG